jgi:LacI family transcriptional regulator
MAKVGMSEVALRAGVSVTTVSHVLSGRRPVADSTKAKVLRVVRELDYRPDVMARGLRTRQSMTAALVVPDLTNPFYPMVVRGLEDVLVRSHYHAVVCSTDGRRQEELSFLRQMVARGVDGLVVAAFELSREDLQEFADLRLVLLGGRFDADVCDLVRSDDEGGLVAVVRHLHAKGHRRVAYVGGMPGAGPSDLRERGFRRAMAEVALPCDESLLMRGDFTRAAGREAARRLLSARVRPDAIVCANDLLAIGVLDIAREYGIDVPGDLAVTGFDDIEAASLVTPGLTTVLNPAREVGRACAELLLQRLAQTGGPFREVVLASSLIVRESA